MSRKPLTVLLELSAAVLTSWTFRTKNRGNYGTEKIR
jgi:hypothetical protein